jgi:hypothetical protein
LIIPAKELIPGEPERGGDANQGGDSRMSVNELTGIAPSRHPASPADASEWPTGAADDQGYQSDRQNHHLPEICYMHRRLHPPIPTTLYLVLASPPQSERRHIWLIFCFPAERSDATARSGGAATGCVVVIVVPRHLVGPVAVIELPQRTAHLATILAGLIAIASPVAGDAQQPPAAPPVAPYRPGLGDLMTMTVQPRHTKLGLAGREGNWPYAAYELHELEESFERAAKVWPKYRHFLIPEMIEATTKEPMAALEQAIKDGDAARFTTAYGQLTAACNTCHQSAERGVIVIQVPEASPFPDQDFRAVKK